MIKSMSILRLRLHLVLSRRLSVIAGEETAPDGVVMCSRLTRRPMNYTLTTQTTDHLSALTYSSPRHLPRLPALARVLIHMINRRHS